VSYGKLIKPVVTSQAIYHLLWCRLEDLEFNYKISAGFPLGETDKRFLAQNVRSDGSMFVEPLSWVGLALWPWTNLQEPYDFADRGYGTDGTLCPKIINSIYLDTDIYTH
jgi:hypothetical protein